MKILIISHTPIWVIFQNLVTNVFEQILCESSPVNGYTLFELHLNTSLQLTYKFTYIFAYKSKSHEGIRAVVIFFARKDRMIIFSTMVFVLNGTVWVIVTKTLEI